MPFWKCYYHVIWATKNREAVITALIEQIIFQAIQSKSDELRCSVLAVNGVSDHMHVAVSIRPALAVGDWVGQIKGASSRAVNQALSDNGDRFRWQNDYGVLSFGARNLDFVLEYVQSQKEHHRAGSIQPYLEQIDE